MAIAAVVVVVVVAVVDNLHTIAEIQWVHDDDDDGSAEVTWPEVASLDTTEWALRSRGDHIPTLRAEQGYYYLPSSLGLT